MMSKQGLNAALKYGEKLKEFNDISEAEDYFLSYKNDLIKKFEILCVQNSYFLPDYTVESLKKLEKWYFDLYDKNEFDKVGLSQNEFEKIMSIYFGEVIVKNNEDAKWLVMEYPFSQKRYEFYVNKGNFSMSIINAYHDLHKRQNNKRRNLLFREYNKYFAR